MHNSSTPQQLLGAIRVATGNATVEWATDPTPLTGGFWAEMWRVRLSGEGLSPIHLDRDLVARIMPDAEVAERETIVQAHLANVGYPTPAIRLSSPPVEELDRAWMLMDFAHGSPKLDGLSGLSAIIKLPRIAKALPDLLARLMADLHRIDAEPLQRSLDIVDDHDAIATLLDRLGEQANAMERTDLAATANWIAERRPSWDQMVICHGDFHPFNTLTSDRGDTVLDWSAAQIADPAFDVAYTQLLLANPPLSAPAPLRPVIAAAGRSLARQFTRTYDRLADRVVDPRQLEWYSSLQALRVLIEVATWRAQNELKDHPGHPFLALAPGLTATLQQQTGVTLEASHLPA